jgi:hypothetical protein
MMYWLECHNNVHDSLIFLVETKCRHSEEIETANKNCKNDATEACKRLMCKLVESGVCFFPFSFISYQSLMLTVVLTDKYIREAIRVDALKRIPLCMKANITHIEFQVCIDIYIPTFIQFSNI